MISRKLEDVVKAGIFILFISVIVLSIICYSRSRVIEEFSRFDKCWYELFPDTPAEPFGPVAICPGDSSGMRHQSFRPREICIDR